ncbi:hypothetical protein ACRAWF_07980 [Streptomyces sp. L7]
MICDELVVFSTARRAAPGSWTGCAEVSVERRGLGSRRTCTPSPSTRNLGGLISRGYDHSGNRATWPCDPDPDRWKVVTDSHGLELEVFEGRVHRVRPRLRRATARRLDPRRGPILTSSIRTGLIRTGLIGRV